MTSKYFPFLRKTSVADLVEELEIDDEITSGIRVRFPGSETIRTHNENA